ncbi:hypothetical protein BO86DRAFT_403613 [Aspergillus japonicus CBS 114.51]|uniref:Uncharacterized protein n=1 Tax=Aspergillus japonicus CBS 114.51 TaxID=1448312 RepID=A0A8T8WPJ9_ASPJA|nr:hypothetical protein BO86DRAFT_403613 [Aspergillus japonicus CBS 114.51]RAH77614.1 hypothetical protein BO86DRAFT_403613 [Aspergillus japonicus CBS 114.51]
MASAPTFIASHLYHWETEFEGHAIQVSSERKTLDAARGDQTLLTGNIIPIFCFETPADLAAGSCPWEFAQRFLQHEWRLQRQNHTYPADMLFAGSVSSLSLQTMRLYYEESPRQPGAPLLWSKEGRADFPLAGGMRAASDTLSVDLSSMFVIFSFMGFMIDLRSKRRRGDGANPQP